METILKLLKSDEFAPYYAGYLEKVENADMVEMMIRDLEKQLEILENLPEEKYLYRYKEGKWSAAELILHVCDCEMVFAFRSLHFARNDKNELAGFDQDEWVAQSKADHLSKKQIIGLFKTTRNHSIALFKSYSNEQMLRIGTSNKVKMSVRALGYIIIGHNRHHFEILSDFYS
jgi:hypothetical protein